MLRWAWALFCALAMATAAGVPVSLAAASGAEEAARAWSSDEGHEYSNDGMGQPSADGTRIVFSRWWGEYFFSRGVSEIFIMDADGSNVRQLTDSPSIDWKPTLSPDGSTVAFSSDRNGNFDIFLIKSDGTGLEALTTHAADDVDHAEWSPDGTRLLFTSERGGEADVFVMNTDGSHKTNLTRRPEGFDGYPAWSPGGDEIAFVSDRGGNSDIYVMKADGSGARRVTTDPGYDSDPAWSPDGRFITYISLRDRGRSRIFGIEPDGSGETQLTDNHDLEGEFDPVFLSDDVIMTDSRADGLRGVVLIDAGSGALIRKLTNTERSAFIVRAEVAGVAAAVADHRAGRIPPFIRSEREIFNLVSKLIADGDWRSAETLTAYYLELYPESGWSHLARRNLVEARGGSVPMDEMALRQVFLDEGAERGISAYRALQADYPGWKLIGENPLRWTVRQYIDDRDDGESALAIAEFYLSEYPSSPQARHSIADSYVALGREADAVAVFEEILEVDPRNRRAKRRLAELKSSAR